MEKYQIAVLGSQDAVLGFRALGISALSLSPSTAESILKETVAAGTYAIIFITEDWADRLEATIAAYRELPLPAIVSVPAPQGSSGAALKNLKKIVEQAVGSDILFKD